MDEPRELLRRAAENRRAAAPKPSMPEAPAAPAPEMPVEPARREPAQPHHATYTALMRSHDRVRTQHLPVQGGGGDA